MKKLWMLLVVSAVLVSGFTTAVYACGGDKSHSENGENENSGK